MVGISLVVLGGGATWYVWHIALTDGVYDREFAMIAPVLLVFGLGLLIHGERLGRHGITPLMRMYGILAGLAAVLNLHFIKADRSTFDTISEAAMAVFLVAIWFLPAHMLKQPVQPVRRSKKPDEPIEPR
jgi:hypothetical protein